MSLKTWMLGKVNRVFTRADLPPRDAASFRVGDLRTSMREPLPRPAADAREAPSLDHLGRYGPLVTAMREALQSFVVHDLRLHLAIAERDRYMLTSIHVEGTGGQDARELLERFSGEFSPEQVKHYLSKEIIARLPNASAIDLSQFAGLNAGRDAADANDADHAYDDLLDELRGAEPAQSRQPYEVTLVGRWSTMDPRPSTKAATSEGFDSPRTPLAGRELAIDIEDARGSRRIELAAVVPGRRYVIGKDEDCDVVVDGVYASRRHCDVWLDKGSWWVADAGSTNGIRVEPIEPAERGRARASAGGDGAVLEVPAGCCIVLSASSRGDVRQYPRLVLRPDADRSAHASSTRASSDATPVTPIAAPQKSASGLTLIARMASGVRTIELPEGPAPFRVGRSRRQTLVVDWAHEGVSGHHVDIVDPDGSGARVIVHGDNGVTVDGTGHAPGADFRWKVGEKMVLARANGREPECSLTLSRP